MEELRCLVAQLHHDVVEHHFLHVVKGGNLEEHNLSIAEGLVVLDSFLTARNESTAFILSCIGQVDHKQLQLLNRDEASGITVVLGPNLREVLN